MKIHNLVLAAAFAVSSLTANAASTRGYFIVESAPPQNVDIYNDGKNTYVQAIPGLTVMGATHDGDRYIIRGVPKEISAVLHGKNVTITQDSALGVDRSALNRPAGSPADSDLQARMQNLQRREAELLSKNAVRNQLWEIRPSDLSIYATLRRWGRDAGWQVSWEIPMDFPTTILDAYNTTFETAVEQVLASLSKAEYPPKGCLYDNRVLRVVRRVGDGKECDR